MVGDTDEADGYDENRPLFTCYFLHCSSSSTLVDFHPLPFATLQQSEPLHEFIHVIFTTDTSTLLSWVDMIEAGNNPFV